MFLYYTIATGWRKTEFLEKTTERQSIPANYLKVTFWRKFICNLFNCRYCHLNLNYTIYLLGDTWINPVYVGDINVFSASLSFSGPILIILLIVLLLKVLPLSLPRGDNCSGGIDWKLRGEFLEWIVKNKSSNLLHRFGLVWLIYWC